MIQSTVRKIFLPLHPDLAKVLPGWLEDIPADQPLFPRLAKRRTWLLVKQDPERALRNYRAALALGGSKPLPQLFEAAGAKLAFDADTITPLMDRIGEELAALPA